MATPRRMRERTVAFFEVVASESGTHRRLEQLRWPEFLTSVATTPLERLYSKSTSSVWRIKSRRDAQVPKLSIGSC